MAQPAHILPEPLAIDRNAAEAEMERLLPDGASPVEQVIRYSVLGQGQRIRPILSARIARLAGQENALTRRAGAAVELLHCASLVVDDLPCMDDEELRRGRPAAHRAYGEATALLGSFALVALAARCVVEQPCSPAQIPALIRFQIALLGALDCHSLIEGQDMDLRLEGRDREQNQLRIMELKTVPLFDLAAQAGLMFTASDSRLARAMRRFAREFGMAFQMADDLLDGEGVTPAALESQLETCRGILRPFRPASLELEELVDYLRERTIQ